MTGWTQFTVRFDTERDAEESGAAFSRTEISCPSAMRWSFSLRFDGLMETGVRAGRDTPIEYIYADEQ